MFDPLKEGQAEVPMTRPASVVFGSFVLFCSLVFFLGGLFMLIMMFTEGSWGFLPFAGFFFLCGFVLAYSGMRLVGFQTNTSSQIDPKEGV